MTDDVGATGGTQRAETARDPDLPRTDDTVKGAQEQDDGSKATAGVKLPGGAKAEVSTDGNQASGTVTIPLGDRPQKPVDTTPSPTIADAPADPSACVGADGGTYPNGWETFQDGVAIERCVNGIWVPVFPPAPPAQPGDYETPTDPATAVAWNDAGDGTSDPDDYSA